jgi:zinc protease
MGSQKQYRFPPVIEEKLANGLTVLWVMDHEQSGITLAFQVPAGDFSDPISFEGTAELCIACLCKGPASMTPEQFSEKFEYAGAGIFTEVGEENCIIGCRLMSKSFDTILPLFWQMLTAPGFGQKEISRLKREMITGLKAELSDPAAIADRHFSKLIFGSQHPAGRQSTIRSIKRNKKPHIIRFYDDHLSPQEACFVIAGDFDVDTMRKKWTGLLASWDKKSGQSPQRGREIEAPVSTVIRLVDKPDITQTSIMFGHTVPGELSDQRSELALANYILGGGNFSSRLMDHIRSKQGKTYQVSSQIACSRNFGVFTIATSTQNDQLASVLDTIQSVYRSFGENGVSAEEVQKAKQFAIGNMAFQLEGIVNVAEKLLWLRQFGRDISYIERFPEMIAAVSLDSVNAAVRRYLASRQYVLVAVGRKEQIIDCLKQNGPVHTVHFRKNP